jgi:hypothetical protein
MRLLGVNPTLSAVTKAVVFKDPETAERRRCTPIRTEKTL